MSKFLRRIRGAIGMGITWGAAWAIAGMAPRWMFGIETDVPFPIVFGALGFTAGVIFAAVLALTEGHRTLEEMSLPRFAGWGALGGFLLSALFARGASLSLGDVLVVAPTFVLACAASASGSLALARRAERRELSSGGSSAAKVEKISARKF